MILDERRTIGLSDLPYLFKRDQMQLMWRHRNQRWEPSSLPSPFRFNADTPRKKFRSGAYSNQMKQVKMILKAQEAYF